MNRCKNNIKVRSTKVKNLRRKQRKAKAHRDGLRWQQSRHNAGTMEGLLSLYEHTQRQLDNLKSRRSNK